jgi:hypothetical protein
VAQADDEDAEGTLEANMKIVRWCASGAVLGCLLMLPSRTASAELTNDDGCTASATWASSGLVVDATQTGTVTIPRADTVQWVGSVPAAPGAYGTAVVGLLFMLFVAVDLVLFGVLALDSIVITALLAVGLVGGGALGWFAAGRHMSPAPVAAVSAPQSPAPQSSPPPSPPPPPPA